MEKIGKALGQLAGGLVGFVLGLGIMFLMYRFAYNKVTLAIWSLFVISQIIQGIIEPLYRIVQSVLYYFVFTESFDRRPPMEGLINDSAPEVLKVLKLLAQNLLTLYSRERELEDGQFDEGSEVYVSSEIKNLKRHIKTAKPNFRWAQNAAQFYGYKVPDKLMKVIKCKSLEAA